MRGLSVFKFEWHSRGQRFDPAYLHHLKNRIGMGVFPVSSGYFFALFFRKNGQKWAVLRKKLLSKL